MLPVWKCCQCQYQFPIGNSALTSFGVFAPSLAAPSGFALRAQATWRLRRRGISPRVANPRKGRLRQHWNWIFSHWQHSPTPTQTPKHPNTQKLNKNVPQKILIFRISSVGFRRIKWYNICRWEQWGHMRRRTNGIPWEYHGVCPLPIDSLRKGVDRWYEKNIYSMFL